MKKTSNEKVARKIAAGKQPTLDEKIAMGKDRPRFSPRTGLNAHRVTLYLSPDEKDTWAQAAALDGRSMSAMVRDLVRKHHRVLLKQAGKKCPA